MTTLTYKQVDEQLADMKARGCAPRDVSRVRASLYATVAGQLARAAERKRRCATAPELQARIRKLEECTAEALAVPPAALRKQGLPRRVFFAAGRKLGYPAAALARNAGKPLGHSSVLHAAALAESREDESAIVLNIVRRHGGHAKASGAAKRGAKRQTEQRPNAAARAGAADTGGRHARA